MFTGYKDTNASSLFQFSVRPGRDVTYGLHAGAYHLLQHPRPFPSQFPLFSTFSRESPHTFLAQANLQCSLSSLRSSQTCCLTQKSSLHVCAAGRGQQGLPVSPFPPTNRKVAPGRQESRSLLAGRLGLSPSDLSVRTPRWAFHSGSSLALVTSCRLPYPPTPPQFRMGLRD